MKLDTLSVSPKATQDTVQLLVELSKTAKQNAYTLTDTKHTAITMIVKTILSFMHTATQTTCTLVHGLMDMCVADIDGYVRPLCRKAIEYQYWYMRLLYCNTASVIGESICTHGKEIIHMMDSSVESVRNQVETIYTEELSDFTNSQSSTQAL